jgi:protein SCO1/2
VGKDFSVLVVSFDPTDTPSMAAAKKKAYLEQYDQASASSGWHFLTGEEDQVRRIADTVGFRYFFDSQTREYAHASGIMVLTPDGRVSRYFLGLDYPDRDLRLALVEASQGSIGTTTDRLLLFCLSYDPVTNRYRLTALSAVRIAGVVTVLAIGAGLVIAWRRERRRKRTTTSVMPAREGNDGA